MKSLKAASIVAIVFGLLTIASGGSALFGSVDMGDVVPFVLWFNFFAGFAYVIAGVGLWLRKPWAAGLAIAIAGATALIGLAFVTQVLRGVPYEPRTVGALVLRIGIWVWIAIVARRLRKA